MLFFSNLINIYSPFQGHPEYLRKKQAFCCFLTLVSPREFQTLESGSHAVLHTDSRLLSQAPSASLAKPCGYVLAFTYL